MKLNKNFRPVCDYSWVASPRGSWRGYVRGNTRRWKSKATFGYNFPANTSWNISKTSATVSSSVPNTEKVMKTRRRRPSSAFIVSKGLDSLVKHEFLIWLLKWNNRKLCSVTSFRKRNNKKLSSVKYFPSTVRTRLQSWFVSVQPRVRKERHGVGAKYGLRRRELSQESRISHQQGMKQIRVNNFNE